MKNKLLLSVLGLVVIMSLLITSCAPKTTSTPAMTATTSKPTTTIPTTTSKPATTTSQPATTVPAKWWDKFGQPQYGGTLTIGMPAQPLNLDPTTSFHGVYDFYNETLWALDWTLDRNIWSFKAQFCPDQYWTGLLAKTWEMKDPVTMVVKLQEGVKWQNKAPVNGREFTADDVVYHYDRHLGLGSGFTKPVSFASQLVPTLDKVTALDKYTVQFKYKAPSVMAFTNLSDLISRNMFEAREQVEMADGFKNWKNAVGTGPWILTDYIADSSYTLTKNSNYWGKDPRYPKNQLPYADQFVIALIPDLATRIAALRTGKVDYLNAVDWQQTQSLIKSNPELVQHALSSRLPGLDLISNKAPWNDLNVRKALDMAIDRKGIAQSLYGGTSDGLPCSSVHPFLAKSGYGFPYDEWSQSLKDEYAFNPTKAKELIAQAGFPNGFKTTMQVPTNADIALLQVFKANWKEIGIDIEIVTYEPAAFSALTASKKIDNMAYNAMGHIGSDSALVVIMGFYTVGDARNNGLVNDPVWEGLVSQFNAATTMDQVKTIMKQADRRATEQHWSIGASAPVAYDIYQPYLKGSSGELILGINARANWTRLWIDQAAKKALGR